MLLVLSLFACQQSKVPEDALRYEVTVTATADECHPDATQGYEETFEYAVAFDGTDATIYIGEDVFASGTIMGCDLEYRTVVIGGESQADGPFKWQLFGTASVDPAEGDACVDGDDDWAGNEYFEIVSSEEETLEPGCEYQMETTGSLVSG